MRFADLEQYDYELPEELIRKQGVEPRDSARLFIYDTVTDTVSFDVFRNLAKYLPERSLVVLNDTKVLPARLWLKKETGGKIEVFVLANEITSSVIPASEPESRDSGSRVKPGMTMEKIPVLVDRKVSIGQKLFFPNNDFFEVVGQEENVFFVKLVSEPLLNPPLGKGEEVTDRLFTLLETFGETPLPHYLEEDEIPLRQSAGWNDREKELRKRYQTVFAKTGASVAAPTASLHFTDDVFRSLDAKGTEIASLTLNVGLGTFAPLREENFITGKLHAEFVDVSEETARKINAAKGNRRDVIAVGTTVARTLESLGEGIRMKAYAGKTDIFIYPPYEFRVVDHFITNFHLPKTSLMLLVDAFLQHKKAKRGIVELYAIAIENKFAFYSFGDSMLIL